MDNAFVWVDDVSRAKSVPIFWRRDWPALLIASPSRVNPLLKDWLAGQSYYWVIDQAEYSTDVLFKERRPGEPAAAVCTSML